MGCLDLSSALLYRNVSLLKWLGMTRRRPLVIPVFNYPVGGAGAQQVRDNNDIHIVFSDRSHNKAYAEPYAQRVLSEQKMGSPFYVIGEKNGYYKVVAANQELLGSLRDSLHLFTVAVLTLRMLRSRLS